MRKVINLLILSVASMGLLASCGKEEPNPIDDVTYTITFKQEGYQDIVKTVKEGESLTEFPNPKRKTGYSVVWDKIEFSNVSSNIIVNAVATANKYTVTYSALGFAIDGTTVELTFDSKCDALDMSLTKGDSIFNGWKYNDTVYTNESIWNIANDVTVVADWSIKQRCLVTFIDLDESVTTKIVYQGEDLTDIPTPKEKTGYTVSWDASDFTNITTNMIVNAVAVANSYAVTYDAEGTAIDGSTVELVYDSKCTNLNMLLEKTGFEFIGWQYNDVVYTNDSIWNVADNVTLTAKWQDLSNATITFVDSDDSIITKTVEYGGTLTDIPTPKVKTGYTVKWDRDDFANLVEDITVVVITTAKTYTVYFDANGGEISKTSVTVTYDQAYSFEDAFNEDYFFDSWTYNEESISSNGTWNIDEEDGVVELVAKWGESKWTDIL